MLDIQNRTKDTTNGQSRHFAVTSREAVCVQQVSELLVTSGFRESRGNTGPYVRMNRSGVTAWHVWVQGLRWQAARWQTHTCSDIFCRPWLRKNTMACFPGGEISIPPSLTASPPAHRHAAREVRKCPKWISQIWSHKNVTLVQTQDQGGLKRPGMLYSTWRERFVFQVSCLFRDSRYKRCQLHCMQRALWATIECCFVL